MKLLLTGFEAFGSWGENPSLRIVEALQGRRITGATVVGAVLPVRYAEAGPRLGALLREAEPDAVLSLGLGCTDALGVERLAVNLCDNPCSPDNAGAVLEDVPIDPEGPAAYFATLPVKAIARSLLARRVPAHVSYSAGTFLCNYVLYSALHTLARWGRDVPAGFIHVPPTPEMGASREPPLPGLPLALQIEGVEAALEVVLASLRRD